LSCGGLNFKSFLPNNQEALRRLVSEPPLRLDFNLLGNQECIVDIYAEIPDCALNLGVA
jgi:hypothetical protein